MHFSNNNMSDAMPQEEEVEHTAETLFSSALVQPEAKLAKDEMLEFLTNNGLEEMTYKDMCFQVVESKESVKAADVLKAVLMDDYDFDDGQVSEFQLRMKAKKEELKAAQPSKSVLRIKKPPGLCRGAFCCDAWVRGQDLNL